MARRRAGLLALLVVVVLPLFFWGGPDWLSPPLYRGVWNLGHVVFFALLLVLIQCRWVLKRWPHWLMVFLAVGVLGGVIEWAQSFIGRQATWSDIQLNLLGAGLGLFWGQRANGHIWWGRILFTLLLIFPLGAVGRLAWVQYEAMQQFPSLGSFETARELLRWRGKITRVQEAASHGDYSLRVGIGQEKYSGIALNTFLGDWRGYKVLALDIFNPDEDALPLIIRVHDKTHDLTNSAYNNRFNRRFVIEPGWNRLQIPLQEVRLAPAGRSMHLGEIRALGIFTVWSQRDRVIYIDNLRLE